MRKGILIVSCIFAIILCVTASHAATQYKKTLRHWTERQTIFSTETLNAKILWHSTYLSPEFRASAREQVDIWKKLPPGEISDYVSYLADNTPGTFLISIYMPKSYPKINVDADNFWEFTLNLPTGEAFVPTSIESVNITPRERRLFPYITNWSNLYWVKFPVSDLNRPFALVLRSAGVTSILEWK